MSELPSGWASERLGNLLKPEYGKALKQVDRIESGDVPVFGSSGIVGHHDAALLDGPALVVGRKGNVGATYVSRGPCWPIDTTYFLRVPKSVDLRFLGYQLQASRLREFDRSTAIPGLTRPDLEALVLRVPPSREQRRIVDAIEEQFSRLDAADTSVARARELLGTLGARLLHRALPTGVPERTIESLTANGRRSAYGVLQPGAHVASGVPLVRVNDIHGGGVAVEGLKRIDPKIAAKYPRTELLGGEVLLTLVGTIGRSAVVPTALVGANVARAVGVLPISGDALPEYVRLAFSTPESRALLFRAAHEVARKTLNLEDVRNFSIPVPSVDEQRRIVAEIDRQLSIVDAMKAAIDAAKRRSAALRWAILGRAFRGTLVPQDPSDEPASLLLERIAQKMASDQPKRARKAVARGTHKG